MLFFSFSLLFDLRACDMAHEPRYVACVPCYLRAFCLSCSFCFSSSSSVFYKLLISPNGSLGSTVKHAAISAAVRGADVAVAVDVAVVAAVADTNRTVVAAACVVVVRKLGTGW